MIHIDATDPVQLAEARGEPCVHLFREEDIHALSAALLSGRPLLLRGEPGVGKSQFALAAAVKLKRAYVSIVVDADTQVRDLRWREDLVRRLADAQIVGALPEGEERDLCQARLKSLDAYTIPGPLWWAFNWKDAASVATEAGQTCPPRRHPDCDPANGAVVLIDEIDKADSALPNGLLEALGDRSFATQIGQQRVSADTWPLVVVTTNGERPLPDAFLRRCVVHDVELPAIDQQAPVDRETERDRAFLELLEARGRAQFPGLEKKAKGIIGKAASQALHDRKRAERARLRPLPGQAEFMDLLRALDASELEHDGTAEMQRLSKFFLQKHKDLRA